MSHVVSKQQFLDYKDRTQLPETKVAVFAGHHDAIKRDMQRRGVCCDNARFLDIGCGLGLSAEYWHTRGFRVTGVDLNPDLIARARARVAATEHDAIRYEVGAADSLPFEDESFDIVFANSLLEHVSDWESCVAEWIRILAPGGLLWIETTNVICPRQREFRWLPLYSWWPASMKRLVVKLACGPFPALANYSPWPAVHWFSFFQLRRFLEARDLSVRDRFDCMDLAKAGMAKRWAHHLACSSAIGRWLAYCVVSTVIIFATKS